MKFPIIDFHAHVFPDDIAEKVISGLNERAGIEYFNDGTVKGLLESVKVGSSLLLTLVEQERV